MRKARILLTGFCPFLGEQINPSQIILEKISHSEQFKSSVDTLLLPVSFQQAVPLLIDKMQQHSYDYVLMLGQAGGRQKVNLERVALNWLESEHPDEDGYKPHQGVIAKDSEQALFTSAPLNQWKEALSTQGHSVVISLSAGGYVCNYLYFHALSWIKTQQLRTLACFIHVPYLPEQVVEKKEMPAMALDQQQEIIEKILAQCI